MNPHYLSVVFISRSLPAKLPHEFIVVTACNPMDEILDQAINARRNLRLQERIRESGHEFWELTGASPDMSHMEPGFLTNASKEKGRRWMSLFKQRAFYQVLGDELILLPTEKKEPPMAMGSFRKRLIQEEITG